MERIVENLKTQRHRSSTRKNYYSVWRCFNQFFVRLDRKPPSWEERLTLFVAYMIDNDKKSSMIKSYISAIKAVLANDGEKLNEDRMLLNSLTSACKLKNDRVRTRLPIRKGLLSLMLKNLPDVIGHNQHYLIVLYRAMLLTAYYGLFRIGEITLSDHVIQVGNVHVGTNKKKLMFVLRSSKTHGLDKKPQIVKINATQISEQKLMRTPLINSFCPFQAMDQYITLRRSRKNDCEPFFIFKDCSPVMGQQYRKVIKKCIKHLGLQENLYSAHSTRVGRASDLFYTLNISVETIRKLGRWSSTAIYEYFRQ